MLGQKGNSATCVSPEVKASEQKNAKSVGEVDKPANWAKGAVLAARKIERALEMNGREKRTQKCIAGPMPQAFMANE